MAIKVGDRLPEGTLTEMIDTERPGCSVGPNAFAVSDLTKGKKIVVFGLPGAYTPTCSAKHVGFVRTWTRSGQGRRRGVVRVGQRRLRLGAWAKD